LGLGLNSPETTPSMESGDWEKGLAPVNMESTDPDGVRKKMVEASLTCGPGASARRRGRERGRAHKVGPATSWAWPTTRSGERRGRLRGGELGRGKEIGKESWAPPTANR
jgi:hypothetical protein